MQEAIIVFLRTTVAAGVAEVIVYVTSGANVMTTPPEVLLKGIAMAFMAGVLRFALEYLRQQHPVPAPVGGRARGTGKKHWSHYSPI